MCDLTIQGHHIEVTGSIRDAANEKMQKLKLLNTGTRAALTFKQEGLQFEVHLVYHVKDKEIVAKKTHADLYVAMNQAFDTVHRQLRKAKPNHKVKKRVLAPDTEAEEVGVFG